MGWGTIFNTKIYLSRVVFDSIHELNDTISSTESIIEKYKANLKQYASATPKDIIPKEWEDEPINWLGNSIDECLEVLEENIEYLQKLRLFKQLLEETQTLPRAYADE